MSTRGPRRPHDHSEPEVEVQRLRLAKGQVCIVRTLTKRYGGCLTHWNKGHSHYCPGKDQCEHHRIPPVWKAYTPVQVWDDVTHSWIPWVLEITENLDLCWKHRYGAGQVWELRSVLCKAKGEKYKIVGQLLEERDPDTFAPPFSMASVLAYTYHRTDVRLDVDNPLPDRVTAAASLGDPPAKLSRTTHQVDEEELVKKAATNSTYRRILDERATNGVFKDVD